MSEFSYRLSYGATAPKPYGSIPSELLNMCIYNGIRHYLHSAFRQYATS